MKWCKNSDGSELVDTAQCPDGVAFRVLYDSSEFPMRAYAVFFRFPKELLDRPHAPDEPVYHNWIINDRAPVPSAIPTTAALMLETNGLTFEMDGPVTVN